MRQSYSNGGEWTTHYLDEGPETVTMWRLWTGTEDASALRIVMYDTWNKGVSVMFRDYEEYGQRQGRFVRDQVHKLLKSLVPGLLIDQTSHLTKRWRQRLSGAKVCT